jgi:hypothetical protein
MVPFGLHIIYNGILAIQEIWIYFMVPFMLFLWWLFLAKVKKAHLLAVQHFQKRDAIT